MGNDITIIAVIVGFFIAIGVSLPFIYEEFNYDYDGTPSEDIQDDASSMIGGVESEQWSCDGFWNCLLSGAWFSNVLESEWWQVFTTVLNAVFWGYGLIPFWLNTLLMILRITLVITIARNIWVGGGG